MDREFFEAVSALQKERNISSNAIYDKIANAFVIFCKITDYKGDYFLSYPSYKNKKDAWQNLAYCYDKKIIAKINKALMNFCEEEDDE